MVGFEMLLGCWRIDEGRVIAMLLLTTVKRKLEFMMKPIALVIHRLDHPEAVNILNKFLRELRERILLLNHLK
jgi:hypothetical protein